MGNTTSSFEASPASSSPWPVVIAILGKPGFDWVKAMLFKALRRVAPAARVSRTRYWIGLGMLALPVLFGFVEPYAGGHLGITDENRYSYALVGDVLLVTSLFVLGGDFWDKIRALVVHDARVHFPSEA